VFIGNGPDMAERPGQTGNTASDGEPRDTMVDFTEAEVVSSLNGFHNAIVSLGPQATWKLLPKLTGLLQTQVDKHKRQISRVIPGLKPASTTHSHQLRAAAEAIRVGKTGFKGLILYDPPRSGKMLSALMAIAATPNIGGPSIIVAPSSCCQQWMNEVEKCFS
jgi:hypothetical protein